MAANKRGHNDAKQPTKVDAEVGERLRVLRQACGMSQTDLGGRAGITFQQVQKYEMGRNRVSASRLMMFAEALGVEPAALLGAAKRSPDETIITRMLADHFGSKLAAGFLAIGDHNLRANVALFVARLGAAARR